MSETPQDRNKGWDTSDHDSTQRISPWAWLANGVGTPSDRRNQIRLTVWSIGWVGAILAVSAILRGDLGGFGLPAEGRFVWVLAALPNLVGAGVVLAYLRFLRMTDELVRLVQLQAMSLGFSVWFFVFVAWETFEEAGAPPLAHDAAILVPVFLGGHPKPAIDRHLKTGHHA
jgi:hypothetical protein